MTKEESFVNVVNGLRYVHRLYLEKSYYDSEEGVIYLTTREFEKMKKEIQRWSRIVW